MNNALLALMISLITGACVATIGLIIGAVIFGLGDDKCE